MKTLPHASTSRVALYAIVLAAPLLVAISFTGASQAAEKSSHDERRASRTQAMAVDLVSTPDCLYVDTDAERFPLGAGCQPADDTSSQEETAAAPDGKPPEPESRGDKG